MPHTIITRGLGEHQQLVTRGYGIVGEYLSLLQSLILSHYYSAVSQLQWSLIQGISIADYFSYLKPLVSQGFVESIYLLDYIITTYGFRQLCEDTLLLIASAIRQADFRPSLIQSWSMYSLYNRIWDVRKELTHSTSLSATSQRVWGYSRTLVDSVVVDGYFIFKQYMLFVFNEYLSLYSIFFREVEYYRNMYDSTLMAGYLSKVHGWVSETGISVIDNISNRYNHRRITDIRIQDAYNRTLSWYRSPYTPINLYHILYRTYFMLRTQGISAQDFIVKEYQSVRLQGLDLSDYFSRVSQWYRTWSEAPIISEFYTWWTVLSRYVTVYLKDLATDVLTKETSTGLYTAAISVTLTINDIVTDIYTKIKGD